jgi:septum formation protein
MEPIILASASLRRQEYFRLLGIPFTVLPVSADETIDSSTDGREAAEELALRKLNKALELPEGKEALWVFSADTLIFFNGKIYGKPLDREDARQTLSRFSGRDHQVITAIALYNGRKKAADCRSVSSRISVAPLSEDEIQWYLDSGEWEGAAGAYRIQGRGACFASAIEGSYSGIVGLPLREFYVMLRNNNYPFGVA